MTQIIFQIVPRCFPSPATLAPPPSSRRRRHPRRRRRTRGARRRRARGGARCAQGTAQGTTAQGTRAHASVAHGLLHLQEALARDIPWMSYTMPSKVRNLSCVIYTFISSVEIRKSKRSRLCLERCNYLLTLEEGKGQPWTSHGCTCNIWGLSIVRMSWAGQIVWW